MSEPSVPPTAPELLTADQAGQLLGVSARTIWALAKDGTLRPVRVRSCTRWRRADVLGYVDGLSQVPPEPRERQGVRHGN